jgi:hypothetical protein
MGFLNLMTLTYGTQKLLIHIFYKAFAPTEQLVERQTRSHLTLRGPPFKGGIVNSTHGAQDAVQMIVFMLKQLG